MLLDDYQSILTGLSTTNNFIVHNYFPVPKKSFVLNLASLNASQFEMSLCHASSAIKLAAALGSPYYSIHGFLLDVTVTELGKNLSKKKLYPKPQSMSQFITAQITCQRLLMIILLNCWLKIMSYLAWL